MTQLESKWATFDDSPAIPSPNESPVSKEVPKIKVTSSKPAPLPSNWATEESIKKEIPTPPTSADVKVRPTRSLRTMVDDKFSSMSLSSRIGVNPLDRNDKALNPRKTASPRNKDDSLKNQREKKAYLKGIRHEYNGKLRNFQDPQPPNEQEQRYSTHNRIFSGSEQREDNLRDSKVFLENQRPMTAGARALTMRIGVPAKKEPPPKPRKQKYSHPHANSQSSRNYAPAAPPERESEEIDEAVRAEVQAMFDKMSDKSTSWADLEDE